MSELTYNILLSGECLAHVPAERFHADTLSSQFLLGEENGLITCHVTFNIVSLTSLIVFKITTNANTKHSNKHKHTDLGKGVYFCFAGPVSKVNE